MKKILITNPEGAVWCATTVIVTGLFIGFFARPDDTNWLTYLSGISGIFAGVLATAISLVGDFRTRRAEQAAGRMYEERTHTIYNALVFEMGVVVSQIGQLAHWIDINTTAKQKREELYDGIKLRPVRPLYESLTTELANLPEYGLKAIGHYEGLYQKAVAEFELTMDSGETRLGKFGETASHLLNIASSYFLALHARGGPKRACTVDDVLRTLGIPSTYENLEEC